MKKITVLGAGMVGSAIAKDLSADFEVTSVDISDQNLAALAQSHPAIYTRVADLQDYAAYPNLLKGADFVVTAVPGFMGYKTLEAVILAGKNAVDISFFPENALQLDALAREKQVTVITDCGVAPGMSNLILGRYNKAMLVEKFLCYVGGLPKNPQPPFFYKAPFSPVDVLEEYTRPARLQIDGQTVTRPALSDCETIRLEPVGELEAFNTDGLRSLLITMGHIPLMLEKTLRFPGHCDLIKALQQAGFFGEKPVAVKGQSLRPIDMSTVLLLDQWKLQPGEAEFTIMQVIVEGEGKRVEYNLYDEYDAVNNISSMARTTGYTCTAAVNLLDQGLFSSKGVFPPEILGADEKCFDFILQYLKERKVIWQKKETLKSL
jgi:saccharopine dehydrogenase-like NADP-dependent oxidoreductase